MVPRYGTQSDFCIYLYREAVKKSPTYCGGPQITTGGVAKAPRFVMIGRHVARYTPRFWPKFRHSRALPVTFGQSCYNRASLWSGDFFTASESGPRTGAGCIAKRWRHFNVLKKIKGPTEAGHPARSPRRLSDFGPLAQPVEHRTFNPLVVRSNRTRPTIYTFNGRILNLRRNKR